MNTKELARHRDRALKDVSGEVLELGIGSGLNLLHYGPEVRRVVGVDPSRTAARLGRKRIQQAAFPVEIVSSPAESFVVEEARFDSVVSTFALCTIPEVGLALASARRALKPSGRLFFLEHGLSNERDVRRWQRRLEPMQKRIGGGCHLTRDPRALIENAGFVIGELETYYAKGLKPWSFLYRGVASTGSLAAASRRADSEGGKRV